MILNLPHPQAPDGESDADAVCCSWFGERPPFSFLYADHGEIGEASASSTSVAVRISGSRFAYLRGQAVLLACEMFSFTLPEQSWAEHERLRDLQVEASGCTGGSWTSRSMTSVPPLPASTSWCGAPIRRTAAFGRTCISVRDHQ